jgi:uncharacterized membrane protein YheB (UPF0754 family)
MKMISHSNWWALASLPFVSALIGYVTNFIAVKMLFRPHVARRFCGLTLQGLVPRRQREIAASLGALIERDLISSADLQEALKKGALGSADALAEAATFLNEQVDLFVQRLSQQNPMVGMFLQGPLLEQVREALVAQMKERLPELIDRVVKRVDGVLDVKGTVQSKVERFDLTKLESVILEVSARELQTIEWLGGVLGFLIGVAQVGVLMLSQ